MQNIVAFFLGVFANKVSDQFHPSWQIISVCAIALILLSIVLAFIAAKPPEELAVLSAVRREGEKASTSTEGPFSNSRYYGLLVFVFGDFTICFFVMYVLLGKAHFSFYVMYWYLAALSCTGLNWSLLKLYSRLTKRRVHAALLYVIPLMTLCIWCLIGFWIT
jgi:hypothetical protein